MEKKLLLTGFFLIAFLIVLQKSFYTFAQQPTTSGSKNITSDLNLDLTFAQQNPAPEQKQIVESQTKQAVTTTKTGEYVINTPQDIVPLEIKTESTNDVVHSEQTTSEQVVFAPVSVKEEKDLNQNEGSPTEGKQPSSLSSPETNNTHTNDIPGTSIQEPDDNAAQSEPFPTNVPNNSGQNSQANPQNNTPSPENTIPLENGDSQNSEPTPAVKPTAEPIIIPTTQSIPPTQPTASDKPEVQPTTIQLTAEPAVEPTDEPTTGSVQGVETGSRIFLWQKIINLLFGK